MKTVRTLEYSRMHVIQRVRERYGLELNDSDYDALNALAADPARRTICAEEANGDDIQWVIRVDFRGKTLVLVWSTARRTVTTALPAC